MKLCHIIILIFIGLLIINLLTSNFKESFVMHNNLSNTQTYVLYIPSREKYIKNVMNKIDLKPEYILGPPKAEIKRDNLYKEGILSKKYYDMNKKQEKGEVAVFLGHINILKTFLKSNNKYALIFEDDIYLPKKTKEQKEMGKKIKNLINNVPDEADILYFGYCFEDCKKSKPYKNKPELFNHAVVPVCLHSYLVSRKGAEKLLKLLIPMTEGIDVAILYLIKNKKINAFTVNNKYLQVLQNRKDLGSDISDVKHAADIPMCRIGNWIGNPRT